MRRLAPRPIAASLADSLAAAAPPGLLAEVQSVWEEVAGAALARSVRPISEREGVVTIACESAVWAQELELLAGELCARLNSRLSRGAVIRLRPTVASGAKRH